MSRPIAAAAQIEAELFSGYMKLRRARATFQVEGTTQSERGLLLSGPGHDVVIVAAVMFDPVGQPHLVFKGGDTRPARTLRGEPYVKVGSIGGRLDHAGVGLGETAILELAEETGARVEGGAIWALSRVASPTMPELSTEADHYYAAVVHFPEGARPTGDGGGMELTSVLRPVAYEAAQALAAIDAGVVGEGARARVAATRALACLGYLPLLGRFVDELSPTWRGRFDPLGLPRAERAALPKGPITFPPFTAPALGCTLEDRQVIDADDGLVFRDSLATHRDSAGLALGAPYRVQFLHTPRDLVKVVRFAPDPIEGARVELTFRTSVPLAAKALALAGEWAGGEALAVRSDVDQLELSPSDLAPAQRVAAHWPGRVAPLGVAADASPGQSDLRYHFYSVEQVRASAGVPLREAIRRLRSGDGDAAAECALYRLADQLGYVPELGAFKREILG